MILIIKRFFFIFILIPTLFVNLIAAPVVIDDNKKEYIVGKHFKYFVDTKNIFNFRTLPKDEKEWKQSPGDTPNFGFSKSTYWFKFSVKNISKERHWIISIRYPLFDYVVLYEESDRKAPKIFYSGDMRSFSKRIIKDPTFSFPINLEKNEDKTYYIRIKTESAYNCLFIIYEENYFNNLRANEKFVYGIFFGILIVISFYNLLIFIKVRDKSYIFYILYVLSNGLFQMELHGLSMQYLWPESPVWNNIAINIFGGSTIIWVFIFAKYFLETKRTTPVLNKIIYIFAFMGFVQLISSLFFPYSIAVKIGIVTVMVSPFFLWLTGFRSWYSGFRPARFYLTAWSIFYIFVIMWALSRFALIPTSLFTEYGMLIGSALETVLLSLALGDKMNILNEEKIVVQRNLIKEKDEKLQLQMDYTESISRFVPNEFLNYLHKESILDVKLGDQIKEYMTVLFSDIRSFTTISERLTPQENIDFLNNYLSHVSPHINRHDGFIDKYIGDAIMAIFPGKPDNAIDAAIDIIKEVNELSKKVSLPIPGGLKAGIGIHYGLLMLGTVGEESRIETTVISDAVNVASRLESLTKNYSTDIIISQKVYDALEEPEKYITEKLDTVKVKGREKSIIIYSVKSKI